ncbi:hypothetical protein E3P96_03598 [Wallemia ichthyophaga]|nr:hypothetical protein E3P96_03598 [Wallemia ichthyophaga]
MPSSWKEKALNKRSIRDGQIRGVLDRLQGGGHDDSLDTAIRSLTATALAGRIAAKEYTATRVLEAYIRGSVAAHERTNCLTEVLYERALETATHLDEHLARTGATVGPLHGVPISVKDVVQVKDVDSTLGFTKWVWSWIGNRAADDAAIVKILVHAGAVPLVKTNIPQTMLSFECSNPLWGRTVHPHNSAYTSGGSSGGEAALLACHGSAAGIGTDIGGSLRIPTGYCGLYSIKPGCGRWPYSGMQPLVAGFEGIKAGLGPMARSVVDLELIARAVLDSPIKLNVSEGSLAPVPYRPINLPQKLRFGYYADSNFVRSSPAMRRGVFETIDKMREAGHECIDVGPVDAESALEIFVALSAADGFNTLMEPLGDDPREPALFLVGLGASLPWPVRKMAGWLLETFTPNSGFARALRQSGAKTVHDYWAWTAKRDDFASQFRKEVFHKHNLDGLIAPLQALPNVPHTLTKYLNLIAADTVLYNVTDSTVGIVPVGKVDKERDQLPAAYAPGKACRAQLLEDRMYGGKEPVYNADKMDGLPLAVQIVTEKAFEDEKGEEYSQLLLDSERDAVAELLAYLENRDNVPWFDEQDEDSTGSPLGALTTLAYSSNVDLQRSAALAFAEITEKEVRQVGRDTLEPLLYLLANHDTEVQRASSAALGGIEPLIRQMLSPNVEVQCNAVGCVTNLATHDENKTKIAKSGALVPLTRLARSKDMRVQRNATGALLNMTHSDENRQQLVNAGAIPVLVSLLASPDTDVQYYCTTALSNIAVDVNNRKRLSQNEPKLVNSLVALMESPSLKVQCQSALALRNLASDEKYQVEISVEVQGNSAAALGNLSSKAEDYTIFNEVWMKPEGGLHGYLVRFLGSPDNTFQHIAVWTLVQLLESGDTELLENIKQSALILPLIKRLSTEDTSQDNESSYSYDNEMEDSQFPSTMSSPKEMKNILEAKRIEHELERERQRKMFDQEMKRLEDEHKKEEQQLLSSSSCPSSPPPNKHLLPSYMDSRRYSDDFDFEDDDKFPVLIKDIDGKFNTKLSISRPPSTNSRFYDLDFNIPNNPPYPLTSPNPPSSHGHGHSNNNSRRSLTPNQSHSKSQSQSQSQSQSHSQSHSQNTSNKVDNDLNRFIGVKLEDIKGEIYNLCKDQHGCRYLQKKLEDDDPLDDLVDGVKLTSRQLIFNQIYTHFSELMTDPFGNYLCQKLLEFANDQQRDTLCETVSPELVTISLNMHGTRAVQKMIDYLSTRRQINTIIMSLSLNVVTLIKDLNGNHVIQKCLNRLIPNDNQFIYNAVASNCIEVATHRHGCCVLQRCIDHASDQQRIQLVTEITFHALTLIQDPFGNYVVQYVLDLNDNRFSDGVVRQFLGHICALSVQKFSSNVIEKCIRVADASTRSSVIDELNHRPRLEKLLRDAFGNYVVQTALDFAEPVQRIALVEAIRPILPMIRNTPYGKRIQSKLQRASMFIRDSSDPTFGLRAAGPPGVNNGGGFRSASASNFSGGHSPSLLGMGRSVSSHGLDYQSLSTPFLNVDNHSNTALAAAAHHQHAQQLAALANVNVSSPSVGGVGGLGGVSGMNSMNGVNGVNGINGDSRLVHPINLTSPINLGTMNAAAANVQAQHAQHAQHAPQAQPGFDYFFSPAAPAAQHPTHPTHATHATHNNLDTPNNSNPYSAAFSTPYI